MLHDLKTATKSVFRAVAPRLYEAQMSARARRRSKALMTRLGMDRVSASFLERYGPVVQGGPFAGMRYVKGAAGSAYLPKLVGSYEDELADFFGRVLSTEYDVAVDVGAAEGYYAVGLAMRLPGQPLVHAFDSDPYARALCAGMAALNGVADRVVVHGACNPESLRTRLRGRALLVCDVEG